MLELWERRSELDLVGYEIDVHTGSWLDPASTIGGGADSFYEYMLKGYILFGDPDLLQMYRASRRAIKRHMADPYHLHITAHYQTGLPRTGRMDALGAFYPGLLVLAGDVAAAKASFDAYYLMMLKHGGNVLAEAVDTDTKTLLSAGYNLRPELVESAYHLYQATQDPLYLRVGEQVLRGIEEKCRTACGFAVLAHAADGSSKGDQMESFLLSETLKYLYLLFAPDHWINRMDANAVFSTEAHLLAVPRGLEPAWPLRRAFRCALGSERSSGERLLQHWRTALRTAGADDYRRLWSAAAPWTQPQTPVLGLEATDEAVPCGEAMLMFTTAHGLSRHDNVTVRAWPSLDQPAWRVALLGGALSVGGDAEVFLIEGASPADPQHSKMVGRSGTGALIAFSRRILRSLTRSAGILRLDALTQKCTCWAYPILQDGTESAQAGLLLAHGLQSIEVQFTEPLLATLSVPDILGLFGAAERAEVKYNGLPVLNLRLLKLPEDVYERLVARVGSAR